MTLMPLHPVQRLQSPAGERALDTRIERGNGFMSLDTADTPVSRLAMEKAKLRKATRGVEAIFLRQLMSAMRKSISGEGLFGGGTTGEIFSDMMDDVIAKTLSERGALGIGDELYRKLVVTIDPSEAMNGTDITGLKGAGRSADTDNSNMPAERTLHHGNTGT